jgi:hypothetical protein
MFLLYLSFEILCPTLCVHYNNLLQKQRTQLQRQVTLAANILAKDKLEEKPGEEDLKELEEGEGNESLKIS